MEHPDYNSPAELKSFLDANGFAMQKKFGQNFMINPAARKTIVDSLEPSENDYIWEIGPGLGCMTEEIMNRGARLTAFEIDRGFISMLNSFFEGFRQKEKFDIVEGDCLKTWKKKIQEEQVKPNKLFGNLPYNIAATFIADTITENVIFDRCVFTVQKEVTERMAAKPGSDNYSGFTVLCQWAYDIKKGIVLPGGNFWPRPNVASQSAVLTRKENPVQVEDRKLFVRTVHALFSSRRKTLLNNIKPLLPKDTDADLFFQECGVSKSERAENLSVQQFADISSVLSRYINSAKI
ncbi:MAG: 16S rRNA (adenine(1518)-N(6)/adenine(1519)-N(6))-dimethyltransferase RsmA [Treponema sp.]|nr:16S rRNA (adenine(1518)-N(6)/adenine(1519)-N(6))-dimethyltransferase RsmA [Treponema sp.]